MSAEKNRYFKLLAIAKRQLQWDDEFYRDVFLKKHGAKKKGDKYSASTMSLGELMMAYEYTKKCGFKPTPKKGSSSNVVDWRAARIKKITALWIALADAGVVKDRSESAMVKYCTRMTKKQRLQWFESRELNQCIEALKKWAAREKVALQA